MKPIDEITDPVEWVRRWILADKEAAQGAQIVAPGIWWHNHDDAPGIIYTVEGGELLRAPEEHRPLTEHLVRHEPQEVIARCDAALAIIEEHSGVHSCGVMDYDFNEPCPTVCLLAHGYRHRAGYREEWRP